MNAEGSVRARVARIAYNSLRWGRDQAPPGVRTLVGALLMIGGVFGFLPILGFWMLPLGLAFVALDFPPARRRLELWMVRLRERGGA